MNLDVSPDGKEIAFDLLGDLYTIPIAGGEARALTHDVAWEMQPRYSPDGKTIAFTTDRGGGDNIWIMNRDGTHPRAGDEGDLPPAQQPDPGRPTASTSSPASTSPPSARSAPARCGSTTAAAATACSSPRSRNDQKDTGEPVFSPDGRYVYFSQDITPGRVFEYNKDPNDRDLRHPAARPRRPATSERFVTGPGGSVRPTPSPDGKTLAFIRRVRYKSVLHLMDLRSGRDRPIYDGLDRDMQETWAIHGVYPTMAWTPDNKSIVFWAGGKIHRIDVASRKVAEIPFHVRTTRRVTQALRFPVEVAPDELRVKMLRWVNVSPKGDRGRLPGARPPLDPRSPERHAAAADPPDRPLRALSRLVARRPVRSSTPPGTTTRPGHRARGRRRRRRGAGGDHAARPLRRARLLARRQADRLPHRSSDGFSAPPPGRCDARDLPGGRQLAANPDTRHRAGRSSPSFGAASDRVYLLHEAEDGDKRQPRLAQPRRQRRAHPSDSARTRPSSQLSPDENWVAFAERFNAYVTPFVATGKAVDVGPDGNALPLRRVTRDAGD